VLAAAGRAPMPSRSAGDVRRLIVLALGFACAEAVSVYLGGPLMGNRPAGYVVSLAVAWAAVALAATWGAVARGRSMLGRPVAYAAAIAVFVPAGLFAASLLASLVWPETVDGRGGPRAHAICALFTVLFALGPLVAFVSIRRRADPIAPRVTGAALGAAAGAWGALGIELHCNKPTPWHVLLGHVVPVGLLVVAGIFIGDWVLRVVAVRAKSE
jgi:hypothetical protein